ncbi:TonB-dependent receptor plug domain-containing protein [Aliarcobacter butzleri]|uniref:TonB-dependent receptor plug domain-containing protein n=1 Tax=Aliarcobacter butzleri TaxID=28197 RepID=UPI0021B26D83|nr:TonB-dependent receptor plug domain-containing protein [Aliarcobacter butzleri]MCT7598165.1 TonB-dependent receptor plug domain-containing protein [Aliarcobacter butzleri]
MKNYIVSKQHANKKIYLTASAITATILLSTPAILSAETVLDEINVNEKKDNYSESYKVDKSSSSKITQDLIDTPQTVQVITKKVMDEQQATTLQEALRNTPGITLNLGENGNTNAKDNINMRGFDVQGSIFKDGIRDLSNAVKDMYNTEAVEVTKGAVGSDNGRGVSSGYINQVSKTAKNVDEASGTAGYSTAKNARLTADLNKALSETTGLRLNVLKQKGDVAGRDEVEIDRTGIATSVAFGIGTATRTTINYEHTEQDDVPDGGIPTVGLNGGAKKADTSKFYGSSDDFEESKSDTFTIKFEQDISDNTMFTNTARYAKTSQEMLLTSPFVKRSAKLGS